MLSKLDPPTCLAGRQKMWIVYDCFRMDEEKGANEHVPGRQLLEVDKLVGARVRARHLDPRRFLIVLVRNHHRRACVQKRNQKVGSDGSDVPEIVILVVCEADVWYAFDFDFCDF